MSNRQDDEYRSRKSSGNRSSNRDDYQRRTQRRDDEEYRRSSASRNTNGRKSSSSSKKRRKNAKRKKRTVIILVVELIVLLALLAVVYFVFVRMNVTKTGRIDINESAIVSEMNSGVAESEEMKGYRNIALFGVDSREGQLDKKTRSDTIMIMSINQDTGDIKLCSVYRDTYLNIGNDVYTKCNAAYATGGPEQAINMLNKNLDLDITDSVTIGFDGLTKVIDALGGVEIDVLESEISHLNNYQISMVGTSTDGTHFTATEGKDYTAVTSAGRQTLNGLQATAYCRIRYVGNDFMRAERQRTVLQAVMDKAKTASASQLTTIANEVFEEIYTTLDISDILQLVADVGKYSIVADDGFPQEDMRATGTIGKSGSCVVARDLVSNVEWLHQFLYDDSTWQVSQTVQSYSETIESKTSSYLD